MVANDLEKQPTSRSYEVQIQLENELGRATLQERVLERNVSFLKSGGSLKKQLPLINCLTKEKWDVKTDLVVAKGKNKVREDARIMNDLVGLLGNYNTFEDHIKKKKNALDAVENEITKMNRRVVDLKRKVLTDEDCLERVMNGRQTLDKLEYKLDIANKKYCTIMTENRSLRDEIKHLLIERTNFNKMWFGFISNLHKGKKFMMDVIEQASIAYDRRDEWVHRLNALRSKANFDLQLHTSEMESLQKQLDCDHELEEFIMTKEQRRSLANLAQKKIEKRALEREKMVETLQHHRMILNKIKGFTKIDVEVDQETLMNGYYKFEDENLTNFLYVNDLHREVEELTGHITLAHDNIEKQLKLNNKRAEEQTERLKQLKAELVTSKTEADRAKGQLNTINNTLKSLYKGITKLFNMCNCNKAPFLELLGQNTEVNDNNVLLYFAVLEDRVSTLLLNVYLKEKSPMVKKGKEPVMIIKENLRPHPLHSITETVTTNPCPLCVDRELVSDIIDNLQFVQNKIEVKEKLIQRLKLPDGLDRLHNVSACNLPQSRAIIQKRYQ